MSNQELLALREQISLMINNANLELKLEVYNVVRLAIAEEFDKVGDTIKTEVKLEVLEEIKVEHKDKRALVVSIVSMCLAIISVVSRFII